MLKPYEYNEIKHEITHLINVYKTVSDKQIIETAQTMCTLKLKNILESPVHESIYREYTDVKLTNAKAIKIYDTLKNHVEPFPTISDKQIEKSFKKVKKIKFPKLENYDLKETNYLAWDDIGTQRKYINFYHEKKLIGFYGVMSTQVIKNACSICHTIGNVSMFMTTTKSSGDGTYTKKGNYICKDSVDCNKKMTHMNDLYDFYETVSK